MYTLTTLFPMHCHSEAPFPDPWADVIFKKKLLWYHSIWKFSLIKLQIFINSYFDAVSLYLRMKFMPATSVCTFKNKVFRLKYFDVTSCPLLYIAAFDDTLQIFSRRLASRSFCTFCWIYFKQWLPTKERE